MRISVDKSHPAYSPRCMGSRVLLDGVEQSFVITADEERGYIVRYVRDQAGRLHLNEDRTEVVREQVSGAVRVDLPARFWA